MKEKSRFVQVVSWEILQLILITWAIERALNYLFGRLGRKFKFGGKLHLRYYLWRTIGILTMPIIYSVFIESKGGEKI